MKDDFDIQDVHRLVDEVVGGTLVERTPPPQSYLNKIPFAIYDTDLINVLCSALEKTDLHQGDIQILLDELRSSLTKNLDIGTLPNIHSLTLNCKRCPALAGAHLPIGNIVDPDIIFVSEYPIDEWPKDLLSYLEESGISVGRAMITFITRCGSTNNRKVESIEISNCSTYLYSEIQLLSPKLIIPLGSISTSLFIDPFKISDNHGIIHWSGPWAIMPIYSLAYLSRKENAEKEFLLDLNKARQFLYGS